MGVEARLVLHAPSETWARAAAAAAFARLDASLSDWRRDSELRAIGRAAAGEPVPVGADTLFVLGRARELARETGGACDPTVGPLVQLWRQARVRGERPAARDLADALASAVMVLGEDHLRVSGNAARGRLAVWVNGSLLLDAPWEAGWGGERPPVRVGLRWTGEAGLTLRETWIGKLAAGH